jgi:urocanate hydratase
MLARADHQLETLRTYGILIGNGDDWSGKIVFCCGPGCALTGIPPAASIAGAVTLAVDADPAAVKLALRRGELDFVVNTLDEALRTIKNEVRQRRPLSVGLIADVESTLAEMAERGVQPDVQLISYAPNYAGLRILQERGMRYFHTLVEDEPDRPYRSMLILDRKRHYEYFFAAESSAALRSFDAQLLNALPKHDTVRRRWVERISHYLREDRNRGRWIWLNDGEVEDVAAKGFNPVSR